MPDQETSPEPEVRWRKSSRCKLDYCVEVADLPGGGAAVRDSKNPFGPVLRFTPAEWKAFLAGVRNNEFNTS
jgi:hypothetical protein